MGRYLVIPNGIKSETVACGLRAAQYIQEKGHEVCALLEHAAVMAPSGARVLSPEAIGGCDCAVILGGDGTVLRHVTKLAAANLPILAINFGRLGYLAVNDPSELYDCLDRVFTGRYPVETRIMLGGRLLRGPAMAAEFTAMNEAVLHRGALSRPLSVRLTINGNYIETYVADGMIVSTPTGSTAYNLSAGGPVLSPDMSNFVVNPICSHTMSSCPIVVSGEDVMELWLKPTPALNDANTYGPVLSADSDVQIPLCAGDRVLLFKSRCCARMIKLKSDSFYRVLRQRLAAAGR